MKIHLNISLHLSVRAIFYWEKQYMMDICGRTILVLMYFTILQHIFGKTNIYLELIYVFPLSGDIYLNLKSEVIIFIIRSWLHIYQLLNILFTIFSK